MTQFIAYYRVSTDKQGKSGLGIDAQRRTVAEFAGITGLIAEYTEVESGKRHTNRPQLLAAMAECKKRKATLLIAKLDRLSRNVAFISNIMESKVDFIACDMPQATKFNIHIMAAVAEHEREMTSKRTTAALYEAKQRGVKLGNPRIHEARAKALASHTSNRPPQQVIDLMREWRKTGHSYLQIAGRLNELNIKPARGHQWYASSVRNQINYALQHTANHQ